MVWTVRQLTEAEEEQIPFLAQYAIRVAFNNPHWQLKRAVADVLKRAALGPETFRKVCAEVLRQGYKLTFSADGSPVFGTATWGPDSAEQ